MSTTLRWRTVLGLSVFALGMQACKDDDKADTVKDENKATADAGDKGGDMKGDAGEKPAQGTIKIPTDSGMPVTMLPAGVVGQKCDEAADCGGAGAQCAERLSGGALGQLIGGSGPTGGYCTAGCTSDEQCGEGGLCFGYFEQFGPGECRKPCSKDADCGRKDNECATLVNPPLMVGGGMTIDVPASCQPKTVAVSYTNEVGKACNADADCNGGTCSQGQFFPDGYCSGGCYKDADCGAGGVCRMNLYGTGGDCFESCKVDSDCARDAMGYGCLKTGDLTVCAAKSDPLPDGVVGSACADNSMCGTGVCAMRVGPEQVATPGGYCSSLDCTLDTDCGAGGVCSPTMGRTRCYKGCTDGKECREGYSCVPRGDDQRSVCFPDAVMTSGDAGMTSGDAGMTSGDAG